MNTPLRFPLWLKPCLLSLALSSCLTSKAQNTFYSSSLCGSTQLNPVSRILLHDSTKPKANLKLRATNWYRIKDLNSLEIAVAIFSPSTRIDCNSGFLFDQHTLHQQLQSSLHLKLKTDLFLGTLLALNNNRISAENQSSYHNSISFGLSIQKSIGAKSQLKFTTSTARTIGGFKSVDFYPCLLYCHLFNSSLQGYFKLSKNDSDQISSCFNLEYAADQKKKLIIGLATQPNSFSVAFQYRINNNTLQFDGSHRSVLGTLQSIQFEKEW